MGKYGYFEFYNKFIGLNSIWRMDIMANMAQIVVIILKSTLLKKITGFFAHFQCILI